jgi:ubiquinone/menaquinone biosynthesis C-methylase UbiE
MLSDAEHQALADRLEEHDRAVLSGHIPADDPFSREVVKTAYDTVASDYVLAFGDDLAQLPVDRNLLDAVVGELPARAMALDLGCGPGTAGSYLRERGVRVVGVDLSSAMLAIARTRGNPLVTQADMLALPFDRGLFTVAVAYYSVQHVPRTELGKFLGEVARVLVPSGLLLVAAHLGDGDVFSGEFLGHEVPTMGGALYLQDELVQRLQAAGFVIETAEQRGPLAHEYPSQRAYLCARLSGD